MSRLTPLDLAILKTLVYFDCLDRALTATEVWRHLAKIDHDNLRKSPRRRFAPARAPKSSGFCRDFLNILKALEPDSALRKSYIDEKNGYYFLKGRAQLYDERIERLKISDQWWKKMRRIGRWMQLVPYVRLVMASGSLAMEHMTRDSDLDVLVVLKHGRIWMGRFLLTALLHLMGVRRHGKHIAGRVCLNHYITDQSLTIPFHSLYNAMTYAELITLYERSNKKPAQRAGLLEVTNVVQKPGLPTYDKYSEQQPFVKRGRQESQDALEVRGVEPENQHLRVDSPDFQSSHVADGDDLTLRKSGDPWLTSRGLHHATPRASSLCQQFQLANAWIKNYLPNWQPAGENLRTLQPSRFLTGIARFFEWWLDSFWGEWFERGLRWLQLRRIRRRPETTAPGGRVVADDMMLEFHPNSPEKIIIDKFNKKIAQLGYAELSEGDSGLA